MVAGAQCQIDEMLKERDMPLRYISGYRITDRDTLKVAIEAAGNVRTTCEQFLSKVGPRDSGSRWEPGFSQGSARVQLGFNQGTAWEQQGTSMRPVMWGLL